MSRQVFITSIILSLFAVIGGGLVAFTEKSTAAQIQFNEKQSLLRTLNTIIPSAQYDNDITQSTMTIDASPQLGSDKESVVYVAMKNNKPVAFIFNAIAPNGYNGKIYLLVGIYTDGRIAGTRVVKHRETPGLGDAIEVRRSNWILGFNNQSLDTLTEKQWKVKRDGGEFDQFTGATITPRAVVKAVHQSLLYFNANKKQLLDSATAAVSNGEG